MPEAGPRPRTVQDVDSAVDGGPRAAWASGHVPRVCRPRPGRGSAGGRGRGNVRGTRSPSRTPPPPGKGVGPSGRAAASDVGMKL